MTTMIDIAERQQEQRLVDYRVEHGIAFIELDNPPANTYTYDLMQQLDQAIVQARFDDDVYVLVVSGHGDRFFSAGANIPLHHRDVRALGAAPVAVAARGQSVHVVDEPRLPAGHVALLPPLGRRGVCPWWRGRDDDA